jgi:hypothetical protein
MRIRQIALVAKDLERARTEFFSLLGLEQDFADPGVATFGLKNSVMTIGDTFLEVVSPDTADTAAGRQLLRRHGDGGYMVISQVENLDAVSARVNKLGLRKVWEIDLPNEAKAFHLHPKDVPGAICSFDEMTPPQSWKWAGEGWENRAASHVVAITAVELQFREPESMAARWSAVFDRPLEPGKDALIMRLQQSEVRFVQANDQRGDGLCGMELTTRDWPAVAAAAKRLQLPLTQDTVTVCGMQLKFVQPV